MIGAERGQPEAVHRAGPCSSPVAELSQMSPPIMGRSVGESDRSPRLGLALGPRADFVPAIVDGVFKALPGARVAQFPITASVSL
jgi:hypothetical protein